MDHRQTFGRRAAAQAAAAKPHHETTPAGEYFLPPPPSNDDDTEASMSLRRVMSNFPWRQFSLMAGLCFGIASFVLPAAVNDAIQWPLYILTAISLWAGLRKRGKQAL